MTVMTRTGLERLKEYAKAGGKVIFVLYVSLFIERAGMNRYKFMFTESFDFSTVVH